MAKFDLSKLKLPFGKKGGEEPAPTLADDDGGKKKKLVMGVVGAATVAIIGWLAFDTFMAEPPPPPPPPPVAAKPKPPAEVPPEKLAEELMAVTGITKSLDQIQQKFMQGAQQAGNKSRDPAVVADVEKILGESFRNDRFKQRVRDGMTKDFDRKRVQSLIASFKAPGVQKIIQLEGAEVDGKAMAEFLRGLQAKPLAKERVQMLQQLDASTRSSEVLGGIVLTTTRAMVVGAAGADGKQVAAFDKGMETQRAKLMAGVSNAVQATFAYVYRDLPDAELAEYVKLYESEDGKWLMNLVASALSEEFRNAGEEAGGKLAEAAKARKGGAASAPAMAKAPAPAAAPAMDAPAPAAGPAPMLTARAKLDARECLKFDTNQAVHRCAEKFR